MASARDTYADAASFSANLPIDLLHLLSNSLILCHTAPYLSVADTLRLSATCRTLRWLVQQSPQVFRRLDLTTVKRAQFDIDGIDHGGNTWRNVQLDENLTEDECVLSLHYLYPHIASGSSNTDGQGWTASIPAPSEEFSPLSAAATSSHTSKP
jgi:hypothetical protein